MPIEYRLDHSRKLIIVTAAGSLCADDLLNHQVQVHNDPSHDATFSQLNDMRMADLTSIDSDCIELLSQRAIPKVGSKIAFVVRDEINKQLARMFEGFRDGTGEVIRIFSDLDAAYSWIDSPPQRLADVSQAQSRRVAPRVSTESDPSVPDSVDFIAGDVEGSGQLLNVSATGAYIAVSAYVYLEPRTEIELYFLHSNTGQRLHARGRVMRSEELGFAAQFVRVDKELQQLVLDAAVRAKYGE